MSPGRKPSLSPASTAGRVSIILLISLFFNALTANAMAMYVLPVPAGPAAKIRSLLKYALTSSCWVLFLALTGFPSVPWTITASPFSMKLSEVLSPSKRSSTSNLVRFIFWWRLPISSPSFAENRAICSSSPSNIIILPLAATFSPGKYVQNSSRILFPAP